MEPSQDPPAASPGRAVAEGGGERGIGGAVFVVGVFAATLLAHAAASFFQPGVGVFAKYTVAIEGLRDGSVPVERLLDFSPLYLASAWIATGVAGVLGVETPTLLVLVQRLLAAVAVTAFFCLVARRLGRRWGLVAAALLALDSHLLVYVGILEPEILLLALLLSLLVLLEHPRPGATLAAGLLAAAAVATRPTFLPVFLLVPLYFRMQHFRMQHFQMQHFRMQTFRRQPSEVLTWRRRSLFFLAPVFLGLLALFAWAQAVSGSWRTPVMNPGTVAYEGNQPLSRGTSAVYPPLVLSMVRHAGERPDSAHEHYREVARTFEPGADVARVNALWSGRARNYVLDHPGAALERLRGKLLYAFHGFSWHDITTAWRLDALPSLPFSLLAAAALLGFAAEARHWRRALPFFVLAAVQLGVMSAFYVSARQRLVLLPALVYFAVCAVRTLPRLRRGAAAGAVLLVLVLALALALPDDAMLDETHLRRGHLAAEPLLDALRSDDTPLAAQRPAVVEALAAAPWWLDWMRPAWVPQDEETLDESVARELASRVDDVPPYLRDSALFDLAEVSLRAGRLDEAEAALEPLLATGFRAYRGGRQPSDPRVVQARVDRARGDVDAARRHLEAALADEPGDPFALADLAALADPADPADPTGPADPAEPAETDEARELVYKLDRYVGEADRRWLYGQALRRAGRAAEAVEQLEPLAERLPRLRDVHLHLALALADAGRVDDAAAALLRANRLHPEPVIEVRAFADLARRWAAAHPDDVGTQLTAVRMLHQHGMFRDASRRLGELEREHAGELTPAQRAEIRDLRSRLAQAG